MSDATKGEHALEHESSFFKLIDASPDALVVHRRQKIVYANPRAIALFGYSLPELVGRSIFDFVSAAYRSLVADRVFQTYFRKAVTPEVEERLLNKAGEEVPVEVVAIPLVFGGELATLVHIRDVSERKRLDVWLRAEDRLASVGLMAAGIAHEINNPLTYALCNAELLRDRIAALPPTEATAALGEMLAHVHEGVERAVAVTRQVTLFARAEHERVASTDIHHVLDSCAELASVHLRGRASLVKEYGEVPPVLGSGQRLGQVFLNLLINAAEAIPTGQQSKNHVTIRTTGAADATSVTVEIRDTGAGIPRELMGHVFEPLFTTKAEGTGLGLAISRALVTEQGGALTVESEPGKGTVFRVVLRASPHAEARPASRPASHAPAVHAAGKRILIVDDEPRLASVLRLVLSTHTTTTVTSGREALERLRSGAEFDAILSDLWIGEIDGIALFEEIRKTWPGLERRVIFMSGDAFSPRSSAFFRSIENRVIEKPFESQALLDAVDSVLEAPR